MRIRHVHDDRMGMSVADKTVFTVSRSVIRAYDHKCRATAAERRKEWRQRMVDMAKRGLMTG